MKKDKRPAKQEPVMAMDPTSQRVLNELEKSQKTGEVVATDVEDGKRPAHLTFILDALRKDEVKRQNRMAFEVDPDTARGNAGHLYQQKVGLTPDHVLKRITGPQGDDLVNQILQARSNMVSSFGRPRTSRFDVGFEFQEISENKEKSDDQQKSDLREVEKLKEVLWNCGYKGLNEGWSPNLSQTLKMITRDGLAYGRIAIEFIYSKNPTTGKDQVHSFRAVDAATIYKIIPSQQHDQTRRNQAIQLLQQIQNKKFDQSLYERDEYKWVQVVGGKPIQVFSDKELVVYTLYPTTNIEYNGYPLTPIDQALNAIATHINITIHNKMYFENGRASRGMMIIQSDDLGEAEIQKIKLQFHQSINSVGNSWRMPVFGVGSQDTITWQPIDNSGRDKEFQFLSDDTARVILGAFQISPEELPGYAHLSKGSSSQTLSECLHPESKIFTEAGFVSILDALGDQKVVEIPVWTGTKWANASIFWTDTKRLVETKSANGMAIKTSPDHLFRSIDQNGNLCWKEQKELAVGSTVLVNKKPVAGVLPAPKYKGQELSPDMFEVLGWIAGDGNYSIREMQSRIAIFYHHSKERDIQDRHIEILQKAGLNPIKGSTLVSEEEAERIKEKYGFKTVAPERIFTHINNTDFVKFLKDLGFIDENNKKVIPSVIHALPEKHRESFLLGLFSADGHIVNGGSTVVLTAANDNIRAGTRDLLLGLGIRTTGFEGTTKQIFVGNQRATVPTKNKIHVKDRLTFFNKIGFLQDHKQPSMAKLERGMPSERLPYSLQYKLVDILLQSSLPRAYKRDVYSFQSGSAQRCTLSRIKNWFAAANITLPEWIDDYHYETVSEIIDHNQEIQMVDLKLSTEDHMFVSNGFCVHNSNNEYQLTAARDVGLRPLLYDIQDLFNTHIVPKFNEDLSKTHQFVLAGLEEDDPEKEATRLQQDMAVHMTYDNVLTAVEKDKIGAELGGDFPLNQAWQQSVAPYLTVGTIMENFFGVKGAAQDPRYNYIRDPFWLQYQQLILQKAQMSMQQQMMQMQQAQASLNPSPDQGADQGGDQGDGSGEPPPQSTGNAEEDAQKTELWLEKNYQLLAKNTKNNHDTISGMILKRHTEITMRSLEDWRKKSEQAVQKILDISKPKKD
jgi:intein/homing endonuclease